MSSIVRASLPTSLVPPTGIDVEKSPWPSRSAASVSVLTGPVDLLPENDAREHRERGKHDRRHQ